MLNLIEPNKNMANWEQFEKTMSIKKSLQIYQKF